MDYELFHVCMGMDQLTGGRVQNLHFLPFLHTPVLLEALTQGSPGTQDGPRSQPPSP